MLSYLQSSASICRPYIVVLYTPTLQLLLNFLAVLANIQARATYIGT